MPSGILLSGRRFGFLTVGRELRSDMYVCTCACGKKITVFRSQLTKGSIRSCGHDARKRNSPYFGHCRFYVGRDGKRHQKTSSELCSYSNMRCRCLYKSLAVFENWGGRGIEICPEWLQPKGVGFLTFIKQMGPRPVGCTLDRRDVQGHYCPENCRWATAKDQTHNQRRFLWPDGKGEPPVLPLVFDEDPALACG